MTGTETCLRGVQEVIRFQIGVKDGVNVFLKNLSDSWKKRDGTIIGQAVWVKGRFFQKSSDLGFFPKGGGALQSI